MAAALAGHYAKALADAVFGPNSGLKPEDAVMELRDAETLISGSRELQVAFDSPAVGKQRKTAVVAKLADELGVHRLIRNFLLVVVAHRRTRDLKDIRREFETAVDERLGWVPAEITSARELGTPQRQEIERILGGEAWEVHSAHVPRGRRADWRAAGPRGFPRIRLVAARQARKHAPTTGSAPLIRN